MFLIDTSKVSKSGKKMELKAFLLSLVTKEKALLSTVADL